MREPRPLYMGRLPKGLEDSPIEGIDTLIIGAAQRMGAHVVETLHNTYLGTNYPWQYAAQPFEQAEQRDPTDGHPELISV